jgi:hypothetical protein
MKLTTVAQDLKFTRPLGRKLVISTFHPPIPIATPVNHGSPPRLQRLRKHGRSRKVCRTVVGLCGRALARPVTVRSVGFRISEMRSRRGIFSSPAKAETAGPSVVQAIAEAANDSTRSGEERVAFDNAKRQHVRVVVVVPEPGFHGEF